MFSVASRPSRPQPSGAERRRSARHAVRIDAVLHAGDTSQATVIDDLSVGGAGLERAIGIYANDHVEIELPDGRRLPGKVAWCLIGACGVQFAEALGLDDPLFAAIDAVR